MLYHIPQKIWHIQQQTNKLVIEQLQAAIHYYREHTEQGVKKYKEFDWIYIRISISESHYKRLRGRIL
jgi:hypothetical protein